MSQRGKRRPRGRLWLHAAAFLLVLMAGYLQFRGNLESSLKMVWASIGVSVLAVAAAVASVLVPGPRGAPESSQDTDER
jgi:hypothetical protein